MNSGQIRPEISPTRRQSSLRHKRDFESISKNGLSRANPLLVLRAARNDLTYSRSAFIVSRKVQTRAVVKHTFKLRNLAISIFAGYQLAISPYVPGTCRYSPTCSAYMKDAIDVHGIVRGILFGIRRLSRCHPLGGRGFDPVP